MYIKFQFLQSKLHRRQVISAKIQVFPNITQTSFSETLPIAWSLITKIVQHGKQTSELEAF